VRTTVINLFAAPGVGKSTLAARLYSEMKILTAYFGNTEYVQEYAKILVWSNNYDLLSDQEHVSSKQIEMLMPFIGNVDYIVMESPIELGLIYAAPMEVDAVHRRIEEVRGYYDTINIYIDRGEIQYECAGRMQTLEESTEIESRILGMLESGGIWYNRVTNHKHIDSVILDILFYVKEKENNRKCKLKN
jgi:hypothetical protein